MPPLEYQHRRLVMSAWSSALSQSRASGPVSSCAVCHRAIALTRAGVIRQHGPVVSRCPGSGRPPAIPPPSGPPGHDSSQSETQADSTHPPLATTLPPRPTVKFLKRIPRASRELLGKKLATILEAVVKITTTTLGTAFLVSALGASDIHAQLEEVAAGLWPRLSTVNCAKRQILLPVRLPDPARGEASLLHRIS